MNRQSKKLKVLVSAYACEPGKGSEPGVGWNWVRQIAKFADVWVITRTNNKKTIERELENNPVPNIHCVYVDLPRYVRFWKKGQRGIHLYYYLWLIWSYRVAKRLDNKIRFDLAQHLTFGVYSSPSFMALMPLPFIWGPIGGVDAVPELLRGTLGTKGRVYEWLRDTGHKMRFRFDPFVGLTLKRSSMIICRTTTTLAFIRNFKNPNNIMKLIETGSASLKLPHENTDNKYFKVFSAGRLIAWKGFIIALSAFAKFCEKGQIDSLFEIAGKGYDMKRLRITAQKSGIADKVKFLGEIQRRDVAEKLANCDVFVYPSLREGGSWALMEALSAGKPIVCLDHSGTGEMVTKECGIKVRPITFEQTVKGITDALLRLANNPDLRRKMGQAARKRAREEYCWEKKAELIEKIYGSVLSNEGSPRT